MVRVARYCVGSVLVVGCDPMHLPRNVGAFNTITVRAVGRHITTHMRRMKSQEFARVLRNEVS